MIRREPLVIFSSGMVLLGAVSLVYGVSLWMPLIAVVAGFASLILRGYVVPRRVLEEAVYDRDEWRTAARLQREQVGELLEQNRFTEALAMSIGGDSLVAPAVRATGHGSGRRPWTDHDHEWVEVRLDDSEQTLVNEICRVPRCWAEQVDVKEAYALGSQTPAMVALPPAEPEQRLTDDLAAHQVAKHRHNSEATCRCGAYMSTHDLEFRCRVGT